MLVISAPTKAVWSDHRAARTERYDEGRRPGLGVVDGHSFRGIGIGQDDVREIRGRNHPRGGGGRVWPADIPAEELECGQGNDDRRGDAEDRRRRLELHEESLQRRLPGAALWRPLDRLEG
jgi:hypothetical protein